MDFIKNNLKTILLSTATLVLAAVAVFTAWRLYELRSQPVAPTAPSPVPAAEEPLPQTTQCSPVTFTLAAAPAPTATSTAGPTATAQPTATATPAPIGQGTSAPKPTATSSGGGSRGGTGAPALPKAGTAWPTLAAVGGGTLLLIFALILAF